MSITGLKLEKIFDDQIFLSCIGSDKVPVQNKIDIKEHMS